MLVVVPLFWNIKSALLLLSIIDISFKVVSPPLCHSSCRMVLYWFQAIYKMNHQVGHDTTSTFPYVTFQKVWSPLFHPTHSFRTKRNMNGRVLFAKFFNQFTQK
ncbi:hypothetical protein VIGAN_11077100 [Vigna angularis var. angularis]|uniref:Secreted protein n=1 Tax=Vigna angularis var. angularis TaxID=157739 RepID=A0A0S3T9C2_PHAAN|nr:hypothetical protein VIGAN_11077100 [Vigna angularis var. angularis]